MDISAENIKKLRIITNAGVIDCKKALEDGNGDFSKAQEILKERGKVKAAKKADRETSQGLIHAYIHHGSKTGTLVKVLCETDFVAKTPEFKELVHNIAMQAAALNPSSVKELLESDYIKDSEKKASDLITEAVTKLGENIKVSEFCIYTI